MKRFAAIWVGIFVTFLWSSSYILNKLAFEEGISPVTLAGLRYTIAVCVMYIFSVILRARHKKVEKQSQVTATTSKLKWKHYVLLGITGYVMAQGLQYVGQFFISPTQTSMMLSIGNNLLVVLLDILWLREVKNRGVLGGIFGLTLAILLYYYPWDFNSGSLIGIGFVLLSSVGYTINLGATRYFISKNLAQVKDLILRPMLIGAVFMLGFGLLKEGIPDISLKLLIILLWLGSINGALAFYLWTWTQKNLRAYESSVLNNLVLLQVAILDVTVLGLRLSWLQMVALLLLLLSVGYVQLAPQLGRKKIIDSIDSVTTQK